MERVRVTLMHTEYGDEEEAENPRVLLVSVAIHARCERRLPRVQLYNLRNIIWKA